MACRPPFSTHSRCHFPSPRAGALRCTCSHCSPRWPSEARCREALDDVARAGFGFPLQSRHRNDYSLSRCVCGPSPIPRAARGEAARAQPTRPRSRCGRTAGKASRPPPCDGDEASRARRVTGLARRANTAIAIEMRPLGRRACRRSRSRSRGESTWRLRLPPPPRGGRSTTCVKGCADDNPHRKHGPAERIRRLRNLADLAQRLPGSCMQLVRTRARRAFDARCLPQC